MIALVVVAVLVGLLVMRRRRRQATLAGLNADRPSFTVEPPTHTLTKRDDFRW